MTAMEVWELLSYVVTVVGLPLAIFTYWREQRKERENEDEETYQLLSDAYTEFLKLVIAHPDLQLRSQQAAPQLSDEQRERRQIVFECLLAGLRRRDDGEATPTLALVGRLHARMVSSSGLLCDAAAATRGRRH